MSEAQEREARLHRLELSMQRTADDFESLKLLVERNNTSLEEFIDLAKAFKFGIKILGFMEKAAVFVTKISLAGGTVWAIWKYAIKAAIAEVQKRF